MADRFKELSTQCMKELTEVFNRMDDSNVRELLEEIKKTPRIFLLAAGREGLATKSFAMRLMHLGKESFWIWDDTTPSIGEGDLMICACGSANVGHENYVADMAKKNGAKLALITPSSEGFLLSIADMVVNVPAAVAGLSYAVMSMRYLPTEYSGAEMDVIAAIILGGTRLNGGVGTLKGCILGTLLLTMVSNSLILLGISVYWQKVFIGAIIIIGTAISVMQSHNVKIGKAKTGKKEAA